MIHYKFKNVWRWTTCITIHFFSFTKFQCNRTNFGCCSRDIGSAGVTSDIEYVELDATVNIHISCSAAAEAEVDNNDPAKDWQWGVEVASTSISTPLNSKSIIVESLTSFEGDEYNILLFFPPNGALLFAGDFLFTARLDSSSYPFKYNVGTGLTAVVLSITCKCPFRV